MFHACCMCLSIQPVHVERLTQREDQDAYEEEWGDRKEQHHSHKEAALFFNCFVHVPERIFKPNTREKNEESFYLHF